MARGSVSRGNGVVAELHEQALAMGSELKAQAGQIDTLIDKAEQQRAQALDLAAQRRHLTPPAF